MKKSHLTKKQKTQHAIFSSIEKATSPEEIKQIINESDSKNFLDNYRLKIVYLEGGFGDFEKFYDVLNYSKDNEEHNKIIFQLICWAIIR